MGYQLGIDLGTTYSAAAVCRSGGERWVEPEVVTLGSRAATVPSVLYVGVDGSVLVGEAAERRAVSDSDRVVREFKRRIGDPTPVVVAGQPWAAEELAARLVRWIVEQVAAREGGPADRIAVTHPASWGAHKKQLLGDALARHGVQVEFLAEPQAAAMHYASAERVGAGSTIAVYDLGGGTFDSAVVRKGAAGEASGFGLLGRPEGIAALGGIDFDQAVFDHVLAAMPDAFDGLDDTDPAVLGAVSRLRRECTEAKETLSADTEASIPVLLPGTQGSVRIHRSELEQMIGSRIEETVEALRRAVASAGLVPDQLSAVLLVGGSSRIPLVAQLVSELLQQPVAVDADPKNAIAKGAALAVSPRPALSWPAEVIAPVEQGTDPGLPVLAGPAGGLPADAAALDRAPVPPMPAAWSGPAEPPPAPAPMPRGGGYPAPMPPPPVSPALMPPGLMPPGRPPQPEWDHEPTADAPRRRGMVGLLVGAGGALAVAAVVVAALTWPTASPASAGSSLSGQSTAEAGADPTNPPVSPVVNPVTGQPEMPAVVGNAPAVNAPAAKPGVVAPVLPPVGTTTIPPVVAPPPVVPPPVVVPPPSDPPPVVDPPPSDPPPVDPPPSDPPPSDPPPVDPPPVDPGNGGPEGGTDTPPGGTTGGISSVPPPPATP